MRAPWRKLAFGGERYAWRCVHEHNVLPPSGPGEGRCREVIAARLAVGRVSSLRLAFSDGVDCNAGYPEAGVVWRAARHPDGAATANLNLPRMARAAIELALERGWDPRGRGIELDGWAVLDALIARYHALQQPAIEKR